MPRKLTAEKSTRCDRQRLPMPDGGGSTVQPFSDSLAYVLKQIDDRRLTKADIAKIYGLLIMSGAQGNVAWPTINQAILRRWSKSALNDIKEQAWKFAEEK
jgi:hypothetical protein